MLRRALPLWFGLVLLSLFLGCKPDPAPQSANQSKTSSMTAMPATAPRPTRTARWKPIKPQKSVLETAHELELLGQSRSKLLDLLVNASAELQAVTVEPEGDAIWHRVTLNQQGARFDAVRFRSPLTVPCDLLWAFATRSEASPYSWRILSSHGVYCQRSVSDPTPYFYLNNVVLDDVDLPAENSLILDRVSGGAIQLNSDYYLCFRFLEQSATDVYLKLKFVPPGTTPADDTVHTLAQRLDFQLPFRFSSAASLQSRVADTLQYRGPDAAAKLIDQAKNKGESLRSLQFVGAWLTHELALRSAQSGDHVRSHILFLEAAAKCRELRDDHFLLSDTEREFCQMAIYNEACVFSLSDNQERSLASLQESLALGFDDLTLLHNDPDLASLRKTAEFQELMKVKALGLQTVPVE